MTNASCDAPVESNRVKWYGIILGLVILVFQHGCYLLGHILADASGIAPYLPKIPLDDFFPLIPVFVIPYAWSYAYWAMAPMAVSKCKTKHFLNFLAAYLFACIAGMIVLWLAPTYMDRTAENLIDRSDNSFFYQIVNFWYSVDATIVDGRNMAYNLLPSFHCLNSTLAYLGVARRKEIPLWFRVYSLVTTLLIFAATLFVKQHYFLDVVAGIAIAAVAYFLCVKFNAGRIFHPVIRLIRRRKDQKKAKQDAADPALRG